MLGKILKYEFMATARVFMLMYALLIVITAITILFLPVINSGPGRIGMTGLNGLALIAAGMLYILYAFALFFMTQLVIVMRFYRMLGDEGYLWFTLPVTTETHILGKLIAGVVWSIASGVMILLSLLAMATRVGSWDTVVNIWKLALDGGTLQSPSFLCTAVAILIGIASSYLLCYAAMAIGPNLLRSRLGGSALAFAGIYIVTQMLSTLWVYLDRNAIVYHINDNISMRFGFMFLVQTVVYGAAGFLVTNYFLKRKLNLA